MSRLVDELLILAKTRRPDFIRAEQIDLSALTYEVVEKCRALGQREWSLDAVASGIAVVDGQRLTQALLQMSDNAVQMSDNAVRHTGDGEVIAIGTRLHPALVGSTVPGRLDLWVRDTGPGVPEVDRDYRLKS